MSVSVEDLVSTLSSNHIGQEATDLAILQNQLAETLYCDPLFLTANGSQSNVSNGFNCGRSPISQAARSLGWVAQPCTTPVASTPSYSLNHGWYMATDMNRRRRNSVSSVNLGNMMEDEQMAPLNFRRSRRNSVSSAFMEDMEDDEQMVEELLTPQPQSSASLSESQFGRAVPSFMLHPSSSTLQNTSPANLPHNTCSDSSPPSPTISLFTSTDPFYIAQIQSLKCGSQPQSLFAQNGRLPQNSPFAQHLGNSTATSIVYGQNVEGMGH